MGTLHIWLGVFHSTQNIRLNNRAQKKDFGVKGLLLH